MVEYSQKVDPSPVFGMQVIAPDSESDEDVKPTQDLLTIVNNLERRIQKQEQDALLPNIPDIPDVKPEYMDKPESKKLHSVWKNIRIWYQLLQQRYLMI